jgi:hypothetical protein
MKNLKDGFFVVGSLAGLFAFLRPAAESKFQRDIDRATTIISKLDEERLMRLPLLVYNLRRVPEFLLWPFDEIEQKLLDGRQEVRFTGPLAKHFTRELGRLITIYREFREQVQVPEWEPRDTDGSGKFEWVFNKDIFRERALLSDDDKDYDAYARHLDAAASCAERLTKQFLRLQGLTELHFFEAMVPWVFVSRKMRAIGVPDPC